MNIEHIAEIAHEINRAYCQALGDDSQPAWADAPDWQRNSAKDGVMHHVVESKMGRAPDPAWSHNLWMQEKLEHGWKHGPEKDAELREHPCIMPFEELPAEQKAKDYIFAAVCRQLARLRGATVKD